LIKKNLLISLQTGMNAYLRLDSATIKRLAKLSGKIFLFDITDIGLQFYCLPHDDGLTLVATCTQPIDATIKGTTISLLQASQSPSPTGIEITGDTELGHELSQIIQHIDIDWEEHLSHWIGDIPAHQIGNMIRQFTGWCKNTRNQLRQNITEYLQEETRQCPPREEIEDFFADVNTLRNDTERLLARVEKLK